MEWWRKRLDSLNVLVPEVPFGNLYSLAISASSSFFFISFQERAHHHQSPPGWIDSYLPSLAFVSFSPPPPRPPQNAPAKEKNKRAVPAQMPGVVIVKWVQYARCFIGTVYDVRVSMCTFLLSLSLSLSIGPFSTCPSRASYNNTCPRPEV